MAEVVFKSWQEEIRDQEAQLRVEVGLQQTRDSLQVVLEERFGTLPEPLVQQINAVTDLTRLRASLRQAVHIQSLDELQL
jgi:hypothetical protein